MKLGVALPIVDIGGQPDAIRDFAQAAEGIGYQGIAAPDHVLGVNVASRPEWTQGRARSTDLYHDPFVLFGFLAGCTAAAGSGSASGWGGTRLSLSRSTRISTIAAGARKNRSK